MRTLSLDGSSLRLPDLDAFAAGGVRVEAAPAALERVRRCAAFCERLAEEDTPHYGINTGFGKLRAYAHSSNGSAPNSSTI